MPEYLGRLPYKMQADAGPGTLVTTIDSNRTDALRVKDTR